MAKGEKCIFYKHGHSQEPLYDVYIQMVARCHNPKHKSFPAYGARGITVCEEWRNDRLKFIEWSLSNGYKKGLSIDRINNDKGYSPENCRWTDRRTQQNNTRKNLLIKANGETHTLSEWARIRGLSKGTIKHRLDLGWDFEDSVMLPPSTARYKCRTDKKGENE